MLRKIIKMRYCDRCGEIFWYISSRKKHSKVKLCRECTNTRKDLNKIYPASVKRVVIDDKYIKFIALNKEGEEIENGFS